MQRLITLILLAGLPLTPAGAAEPYQTPVHIYPQVPTPVLDRSGAVIPASAAYTPMRAGTLIPASGVNGNVVYPGLPLPTNYAPTGFDCPTCDKPACGDRGPNCFDRLKAWLCFQPTTRDALPKCRPHPYVGPVVGIFTCNSRAGCTTGGCGSNGCGSGNCGSKGCASGGCASGLGGDGNSCKSGGLGSRFGSLFGGRGSRGDCVPPSNEMFPGYQFASPRPLTSGVVNPPPVFEHRTLKPASAQYPAPYQPKPYVQPGQSGQPMKAETDTLARPFTRP